MARVINSSQIDAKQMALMSPDEKLWIYNGFDCMVTWEVHAKTSRMLDAHSQLIYDFERGLQAPLLELMNFGIRVDAHERDKLILHLDKQVRRVRAYFWKLGAIFNFEELNAQSPTQLKKLFYEVLDLPEQTERTANGWKPSTNRKSLEALNDYFQARPFVSAIFCLRDLQQRLAVLRTAIRDGRMYTSINIGKETGRHSSSASVFEDGRNLQNIMKALRTIFIADKGMKFGYADLRQAESCSCAYLAEDEEYIAAHLSGNVHEVVAHMCWPEIENVKDLYYRHWTYYDLSKRGGHASNYFAMPSTISKHLKLPMHIAEDFQLRYFRRFKKLRQWQYNQISKLQSGSSSITPVGRQRTFFGRPSDDVTIREFIAHEPQSLVADILNLGMYRAWRDVSRLGFQLLLPVHDAILFQYPEEKEEEICAEVIKAMIIPIPIHGRTMTLGVDMEVGYNWTPFNDDLTKGPINLAGLVKLGSDDTKKQERPDTASALLARRIS